MKRDKNFRISQQVKRTMATFSDAARRTIFKNMMIDAQIIAQTPQKKDIAKKQVIGGIEVNDNE